MVKASYLESLDLPNVVNEWLKQFEASLSKNMFDAAANLFVDQGQWRDLLAFTWHVQTMSGRQEILHTLQQTTPKAKPTGLSLAEERTPPRVIDRADTICIEAFIKLDTSWGPASGILRLIADEDGPNSVKAWVLMTSLEEIRGHEEAVGDRRPSGENYSRSFGGDNWLDLRNKSREYRDREPAVLIVGAGQSGLTLAARLSVLGVDTLLIDKHQRVGDNWRKRYHSLVLHNEVYINHMPYMPFPPNWPVFIPKDKIAN